MFVNVCVWLSVDACVCLSMRVHVGVCVSFRVCLSANVCVTAGVFLFASACLPVFVSGRRATEQI